MQIVALLQTNLARPDIIVVHRIQLGRMEEYFCPPEVYIVSPAL